MIVLIKNKTQNFIVTLFEKTTLTGVYEYLFEFQNDSTKEKYYFLSPNLSTNINRYDKFQFTEGVNDPTNGSLILGNGGFYSYKIYQQNTIGNLDPDNAKGIVEIGKMKLIDKLNEFEDAFTEHIVTSSTNIVYNPS